MTPHLLTLSVYVVLTLVVGVWSRPRAATSEDYLQAPRTLPLGIVVMAYLAANCGALEVIGLSAMAAQYGAVALHFYWIGAVPALIFLSLWMMPLYRQHGIQSVPQFLLQRYGPRMQLLNAAVTAIVVQLLAGISLYAAGEVVHVITTLPFHWSVLLCNGLVTAYVLLGGLRATMYNQVLQFAMLLGGTVPLAVRCLRIPGALSETKLGPHAHAWKSLPLVNPHAPIDVLGVVMGLGCVLSFSYWCTDFVLMQRAFTARTTSEARQVPLLAGFGKLLFPVLVVVPGLAATSVLHISDGRFDLTVPRLMQSMYGTWMLAIGFTALCAGLMSSFAANISAFAAVCTADLLPVLQSGRSTPGAKATVTPGVLAILFAAAFSLVLSYLNFLFSNIMEQLQLIFSVLGVPFWAVFFGGMISRRPSQRSALFGFGAGSTVALSVIFLGRLGVLRFGSNMAADFYAAFIAFGVSLLLVLLLPNVETRSSGNAMLLLRGPGTTSITLDRKLLLLSAMLLLSALVCNWVWR